MKYLILIAILSLCSVFTSAQSDNASDENVNPVSAYAWQPESDQNLVVRVTNFKDSLIILPITEPIFVDISSQHGKWLEISGLCTLFNDYYVPENTYRIKKSDVLTNFRQGMRGVFINVYKKDNPNSKVVGKFLAPSEGKILKIKHDFVKVSCIDADNKQISGWVERWRLCGNPLTTCP